MPWQLIFTSAPRGLASGQSGFCTVARSPDLREAVALRLEQISSYHYLQLPGASQSNRNPTISAYRILDIRGAKYYALTRLQPSGLDFTARTNHLAQHLVFQPEELARLPSPAAILRHWNGWLTSWQGDPRLLDDLSIESFNHIPGPSWPAKGWLQSTGDAGRAAGLLESEFVRGCYLLSPAGGEQFLLELFCETLQLPNYTGKYPLRPWQHTFTTFLQGEDVSTDFQWRGCRENTPAWEQALRRSVPPIQLQALRVPNNPLVKIAREGPKLPTPAPAAAAPRPPLTFQKEPTWQRPAAGTDFSTHRFKRPAPRTSRSISISISLVTLLKGIGLAAVLTLLLWGINEKFLHLGRSKVGAVRPGASASNPIPAKAPGPAHRKAATTPAPPPPPAASDKPSLAEAPVDEKQLGMELDAAFGDSPDYRNVPTYLVVAPSLGSNVIPLMRLPPLEDVLEQLDKLRLLANNIEMSYDPNNWGLRIVVPMTLESAPSDHKLSGQVRQDFKEYRLQEPMVFDYSGLSNHKTNEPPVQLRAICGPLQAFSIALSPANKGPYFNAFRLLVVNESQPPRPLDLSTHFLNLNATKLPDLLKEPLRGRLGRFQRVSPTGWQWQLRPRIRSKDGTMDLVENWPGDESRKPHPGDQVDLPSLKKPLEDELKVLTSQVAELDKKINEVTSAIQTNMDLSLPLGLWLELTNADLESFDEYAKARSVRNRSSSLYLDYLDQIAKQARSEIGSWSVRHGSREDVIVQRLGVLHERCVKRFKEHPEHSALLTLQGSTPNYFLAVWENLKRQETDRAQRQEKKETLGRIGKLKTWLDLIPSRLDQLVALSLGVVGPNDKHLEMIRFSNPSVGKSP